MNKFLLAFISIFLFTFYCLQAQEFKKIYAEVFPDENVGNAGIYSMKPVGMSGFITDANDGNYIIYYQVDNNDQIKVVNGSSYLPASIEFLFFDQIEVDGPYQLFGVSETGIYKYDYQTLELVQSWNIELSFQGGSSIQLIDADRDGIKDWVSMHDGKIRIHDVYSFDLKRDYSIGPLIEREFCVGQFDEDNAFEIFYLNGHIGHLLDLDSGVNDTAYSFNSYAFKVTNYDITGDGIDEVAISQGQHEVIVFDLTIDSILQTFGNTSVQYGIVEFVDYDGDQVKELVVSGDESFRVFSTDDFRVLFRRNIGFREDAINFGLGEFRNEPGILITVDDFVSKISDVEFYPIGESIKEFDYIQFARPSIYSAKQLFNNDESKVYVLNRRKRGLSLNKFTSNLKASTYFSNTSDGYSAIKTVDASTFKSPASSDLIVYADDDIYIKKESEKFTYWIGEYIAQNMSICDYNHDGKSDLFLNPLNTYTIANYEGNEVVVSPPIENDVEGSKSTFIQYDDGDDELVRFNSFEIVVLRAESGEELNRFSINGFNSSDVTYCDANFDGKLDVCISKFSNISATTLLTYDLHTGELISEFEYRFGNLTKLKTIQFDNQFYVMGIGDRVVLFNPEVDSIIYNTADITRYNTSINSFEVLNPKEDSSVEIHIATQDEYLVYELNTLGNRQVYLHLEEYFPSDNVFQYPRNTEIRMRFNRPLGEITEPDDMFTIIDTSGVSYEFDIEILNADEILLRPISLLPPNSTIIVSSRSSLADKYGHKLDVNHDRFHMESDSVYFEFVTNSEIDEKGPQISYKFSASQTIVRGVQRPLEYVASEEFTGRQKIHSVRYDIDDFNFDNAIQLEPEDDSYNLMEEWVNVLLETDTLEYGTHTLFVQAEDALGNLGEISEFVFDVIPDAEINYDKFPYGELNTGDFNLGHSKYELVKNWSYTMPQQFHSYSQPLSWGNYLVFTERFSSRIFCIDGTNGQIIWEKIIEEGGMNIPSVSMGEVYFPHSIESPRNLSKFVKYDLFSGEELWSSNFFQQGPTSLSPQVIDDLVYFHGGVFGGINLYNRWTGHFRWFSTTEQTPTQDMSPVWKREIYNIAQEEFTIFDLDTGISKRQARIDNGSYTQGLTAPILDTINGKLLVQKPFEVVGVDMESQVQEWEFDVAFGTSYQSLFIYPQFLVFTGDHVLEVDVLNGELTNFISLPEAIQSSPVYRDGIVYIPMETVTEAYAIPSGDKLWTLNKTGQIGISNSNLILLKDDTIRGYEFVETCLIHDTIEVEICVNSSFTFRGVTYSQIGSYAYLVGKSEKDECDTLFTLTIQAFEEVELDSSNIIASNGTNGSIEIFVSHIQDPLSYQWSSGDTTSFITDLAPGLYHLTITDQIGCNSHFEFDVPLQTGLENLILNDGFFYPNPVKRGSRININSESIESGEQIFVHLTTMDGQQIATYTGNSIRIPPEINAGLYILTVREGDGIKRVGKLIVEE